jgi:hypothetical protein
MVQQRGRKSTAQLSVVSRLTPGQGRAQPPKGMPADEAAVWTYICGAMPDHWFSTSFHLLRCLCAHVANEEVIARELAKARVKNDLKALRNLTVMHTRETKAILELSKALRLPPRARFTQERSANLKALTPATATRPWEIKHDGGDDVA